MLNKMKFLDIFAGIGGFRSGMQSAGHECVGFIENDKFARKSYKAIYDTEGEWSAHDIRTVRSSDLPKAECWCFGFPCQDISVAGQKKGIRKGNRSSLFYAVTNLLKTSKKRIDPSIYSLRTLKTYLVLTEDLTFSDFSLSWTKSGTMQNGMFSTQQKSCLSTENEFTLSDILEEKVLDKYFLSDQVKNRLLSSHSKSLTQLQAAMETQKDQERILVKINRRK